jgi:hypothetical protein
MINRYLLSQARAYYCWLTITALYFVKTYFFFKQTETQIVLGVSALIGPATMFVLDVVTFLLVSLALQSFLRKHLEDHPVELPRFMPEYYFVLMPLLYFGANAIFNTPVHIFPGGFQVIIYLVNFFLILAFSLIVTIKYDEKYIWGFSLIVGGSAMSIGVLFGGLAALIGLIICLILGLAAMLFAMLLVAFVTSTSDNKNNEPEGNSGNS